MTGQPLDRTDSPARRLERGTAKKLPLREVTKGGKLKKKRIMANKRKTDKRGHKGQSPRLGMDQGCRRNSSSLRAKKDSLNRKEGDTGRPLLPLTGVDNRLPILREENWGRAKDHSRARRFLREKWVGQSLLAIKDSDFMTI